MPGFIDVARAKISRVFPYTRPAAAITSHWRESIRSWAIRSKVDFPELKQAGISISAGKNAWPMRSKGPYFASGVERHAFFVQQDAGTVDDEFGLRAVTQVTALRAASGSPLALDQAQRGTCLSASTWACLRRRTCLRAHLIRDKATGIIHNAGTCLIRNAPPDRDYP